MPSHRPPRPSPRRPSLRALAATALLVVGASGLAACSDDGGGEAGGGGPTVVVTHTVLGAVVREVVGDAARVEVVIPDGADPHDYEPSAKAVAAIRGADAVVANGLGLEAGLEEAIEGAEDDGVPVFHATDHVDVRTLTGGAGHDDEGHDDEGHDDEGHDDEGHDHEGGDPHFWVDPVAMTRVAEALAEFLQVELGLDVSAAAARTVAALEDLDTEVDRILAVVPAARRTLVTGHESLGYFADRYDFELVGAVIPSSTTQAQPSAGQIAALEAVIRERQVPAVFNEVGTPDAVVDAIRRDTGVEVVELMTVGLPDDGSYATFMTELATRVADALR